jgi:hypothetical protein
MPRSGGPSVWVYRWRETDEKGERRLRKKIIGTIKQYSTKARASAATEPLRTLVNRPGFQRMAGPRTFSELIAHYRVKELPEERTDRKSKKTRKG